LANANNGQSGQITVTFWLQIVESPLHKLVMPQVRVKTRGQPAFVVVVKTSIVIVELHALLAEGASKSQVVSQFTTLFVEQETTSGLVSVTVTV
jgi:hypothetical protein